MDPLARSHSPGAKNQDEQHTESRALVNYSKEECFAPIRGKVAKRKVSLSNQRPSKSMVLVMLL